MAKRRRLETPSGSDLERIEAEFRSETRDPFAPLRGVAPIAQIAADSAALSSAEDVEARAARARLEAEAARLRAAQDQGLLIVELPIGSIEDGAMVRDRMAVGEEEMQELQTSIAAHGLRLPIEVFQLEASEGGEPRYALISGYRRLRAVRALFEMTGADGHARIRALIRPRTDTDAAFVAMVEENEVRENLSHFERGRIAVIAAQQGAFANTEDAVNRLFATGSKAKRSKVRSFALIFEELGDMLVFPEALSERRGLRLAAALREGAEPRLRQALSSRRPDHADQEWELIESVIAVEEAAPPRAARRGRPKAKQGIGWIDDLTLRTASGVTIRRGTEGRDHVLRLSGEVLSEEVMHMLMTEIRGILEK